MTTRPDTPTPETPTPESPTPEALTPETKGPDLRGDPRPGRTIARLARHVEKALAEVELSPAQYRVLVFLSEVDSAMASALATRLDVSRPSVTALVDGLVTRGLVERRPACDDRRRVEHRLTAAGNGALRRADVAVDARLDQLATRLGDRERRAAFSGLRAWRTALTRAREALLAQP